LLVAIISAIKLFLKMNNYLVQASFLEKDVCINEIQQMKYSIK